MNRYTELIEKYINGELSETDKQAFEKELSTNTELKTEYQLQLDIVKGINRLGLKHQTTQSFKKAKNKKIVKNTLIGLAIVLAAVGAVVMVKNAVTKNRTELLYNLNEQGKTNWAEADKTLESQVFKLNPLRDTIIETQHGIVLAIPANAFLNTSGEHPSSTIDLEIKEAMTAFDMMRAGLSTMSNSRLLETGGMFYVNARSAEKNLTIDKSKPLNVNVPNNSAKNNMMLFSGERQEDGSINWTDPKPLKKRLVTVDITSLDFYPEHFLDSLKSMGFDIKNKKLTDSIYYSFSNYCETSSVELTDLLGEGIAIAKIDTLAVSAAKADTMKRNIDGEHLFKRNCAVCHSIGKEKLTAPGLAGISERVPKGRWLRNWIINSDKVTKSGDAYAHKIKKENGNAAMTVFEGQLSDKEVDAIIGYITNPTGIIVESYPNYSECGEIDPSRIKAIWDKKFNGTILATKAFEERLNVIFTTCDSRLFNVYVNNLNKNLYEIDSVAATLVSGELKHTFLALAERRDGGVEISDSQNKKLQAYFEEKRTLYASAVSKTLQKMYASENEQNQVAFSKQIRHMNDEALRSSSTFTQELEMNMDEAYRQLGKERQKTIVPPVSDYYTAPLVTTGWYNVDKYVVESTVNRSTLDYTDPQSGKKAVIKYLPISVNVNDFKAYDKVVCYMIPDKLSSFQLMKSTGNLFKENLNELMKYSIVTIGFKGDKTFYNEIKLAKAQAYTIELSSIKTTDLDKKLNQRFPLNQPTDLMKDINYQLFEVKENVRQNKINQREEIRERLLPVVFPCNSPAAPAQ